MKAIAGSSRPTRQRAPRGPRETVRRRTSPDGRGVLVKVLRVGVDGTDQRDQRGRVRPAPDGYDFLVIGHEGFGQVEAVGPNVSLLAPGDFVVATVRRPGTSLYDAIGLQDMTTDDEYSSAASTFATATSPSTTSRTKTFVVKVPQGLKDVGVLLEPMTVAQKGITPGVRDSAPAEGVAAAEGGGDGHRHARFAGVARAAAARSRRHGLRPDAGPYLNADLLDAIGARYVNTAERSIADSAAEFARRSI